VLTSSGHTILVSLICTRSTDRYNYSIIRGSPYDDEAFQVLRLVEALQEAKDAHGTRTSGGSKDYRRANAPDA
jgi:hypothetical protein